MPYREGKEWRAKVTFEGRRYTKMRKTKKAAKDWEVKKLKELKKNSESSPSVQVLLTICSRYTIYAERYSKDTYDEKKAACERLLAALDPMRVVEPLDEAGRVELLQDIEAYLKEQKDVRTANASNKDRKNLHAMWNKARKWGVRYNPVADTDRYAHDRTPQYTPPNEDVLAVLAAATRREKVFLLAYIFTGARRSEIFRWTWDDDINFDQQAYRLGTRKTNDGSMVYEWFPMPQELYEELWWLYNNRIPSSWIFKGKQRKRKYTPEQRSILQRSPWVFPNTHPHQTFGGRFTQRRWFMHVLCDRAKVKPFGYHALRRFFASRLKDLGKGTKTIQRMLRHKNLQTTERYIQALNDDLAGITNGLLEKQKGTEARHGTKKGSRPK